MRRAVHQVEGSDCPNRGASPGRVAPAGHPFNIRGPIGPAGTGAADLAEALANGARRVLVNADGGCIRTAVAMADHIAAAGLAVETHRAASAAVLLAIAGPDRAMAADGWLAVHPLWLAIAGGARELAAAAQHLASADDLLARMIAARSNLTEAEAAHAIDRGKVWDAPAALAAGLVDRITDPAGLAGTKPERLTDGPSRAYAHLLDTAERHAERAALEVQHITPGAEELARTLTVNAITVEAFTPPARLASAFDHAAGQARRAALDPDTDTDTGPPRWRCERCDGLNHSPPAINFEPAPCFHCSTPNRRETKQ